MIKLNRTTEYGLMALRHMAKKRKALSWGGQNLSSVGPQSTQEIAHPDVTSAREISDTYGLPFEITAKTLQRLKDTGLIQSAQGARGGYLLVKDLEDVRLSDFLASMEGPQGVVSCASGPSLELPTCEYRGKCEIHGMMAELNTKVISFLNTIRLSELANAGVDDSALSFSPSSSFENAQPRNSL